MESAGCLELQFRLCWHSFLVSPCTVCSAWTLLPSSSAQFRKQVLSFYRVLSTVAGAGDREINRLVPTPRKVLGGEIDAKQFTIQ